MPRGVAANPPATLEDASALRSELLAAAERQRVIAANLAHTASSTRDPAVREEMSAARQERDRLFREAGVAGAFELEFSGAQGSEREELAASIAGSAAHPAFARGLTEGEPLARAAVSPEVVAEADAARVAEAAESNPLEAAELLSELMGANEDPRYRAALAAEVAPTVSSIGEQLVESPPGPEAANATMAELSKAAALAGPEGAQALGRAFAANLQSLGGIPEALGDVLIAAGPVSGPLLEMFASGGAGNADFLRGMVEVAESGESPTLAIELSRFIHETAELGLNEFDEASNRMAELNGQLNALIEGFGPGADPADLERAITEFRETHAADFERFERSGALLAPLLETSGELLAKDLPVETKILLSRVQQEAAKLGDTEEGAAVFGRAVERQAAGAPTFLDDIQAIAERTNDAASFTRKVTSLVTQGVGFRATELIAAGRVTDAQALIGGLSNNAALFGVSTEKLEELEGLFGQALAGDAAALEELTEKLNDDGIGGGVPFIDPNGRGGQALKALGLVLGVAALPGRFEGLSDQELEEQIRTISDTLNLGADAGSLALSVFGKAEQFGTLNKLFGRVGTGSQVITATVDTINTFQALAEGDFQGAAVSGLNATSGILFLIPGMQLPGAALALASFGLQQFFANRERDRIEGGIEGDAKAFLMQLGLDEDVAAVLGNVNEDGLNAGLFVGEVAEELGLTQQALFAQFNALRDEQRQSLIDQFRRLAFVGDNSDELEVIFGAPPSEEHPQFETLVEFAGRERALELLERATERRNELVEGMAEFLTSEGLVEAEIGG